MSQLCGIYDSAITFKYNEGTDAYNNAMKIPKTAKDTTVLKGMATTKIPTNQKFRNSTSRVNAMNHLPPHECKPSFHDIILICYKCYLTSVLLFHNGMDGGVTTLTKRAYIGNTSANMINDRNNVRMLGSALTTRLMDFKRKSQSFASRYQEMVDNVIGGQRRRTLNTTSDDVSKKTRKKESKIISDMMSNTTFNLGVNSGVNCLTSPR